MQPTWHLYLNSSTDEHKMSSKMSYKKVGSWFLTEAGRTFSFALVTASGIGAFCVQFVPNTFLISQYKDFVHLYRNGVSVSLPKYLVERFNKAIELSGISENVKHFYKPFPVVGFEMFSIGSSYSKYGCLVGLPVHFAYKDVDLIEKHNIKILSESVVWETDEAKDFLDSLVLSEKAQIYGMAREMRMLETMKLYLDSFSGSIAIYFAYGISNSINTRFNMYVKPLGLRLVLYALVGAFACTNYVFIKDSTQLYYEQKVDEDLKHLNPLFVEGAIEFYGKFLQRNMALRKLMGREGEGTYSVLGNENYMFRQRHLPLVQRKAFFEDKLDTKESTIQNVM